MNASFVRVDTSPATQATEYATIVDRIQGDDASVWRAKVSENTEPSTLAALLVPTTGDLLASKASSQDIETAFNILLCLVAVADDKQEDVISALIKGIESPIEGKGRSALRLRLLSNLYNALDTASPLRRTAFMAIVTISTRTKHASLLLPQLSLLNARCVEWNCTPQEKTNIYLTIASSLQPTHPLEALSLEREILKGDGPKDTKLSSSILTKALSTRGFYDLEDLASFPAITSLKGEVIGQLLELFLSGDHSQYEAFVSKNASALDTLGYNKEEGLFKFRLLLLSSLGAQRLNEPIAYAEVARALGIQGEDEDEVEEWVINLIQAGLADARIHQLDSTVTLSRSTHRMFGQAQWQFLQERLTTWSSSLSSILTLITQTREKIEARPIQEAPQEEEAAAETLEVKEGQAEATPVSMA
ncbi:hypothetical protein BJ684DRAFT_17407 [Piptocephalis cylindrospora]|uniref:Eukaryotic translation initiation factor 3 subunit M n=1 Tax=Piptocephalis cylindrospora TaxID=1907219 RepID=A0A4P9XZX7_9FUNG|nr:hypothetical protein BJ684DRAFT_17407 [Piptocephalis cylindrospora]|eukprot:RKP12068.1 hypothetical protein BJ684DRAFT_17407 [Piptocephalis cylindrospora]